MEKHKTPLQEAREKRGLRLQDVCNLVNQPRDKNGVHLDTGNLSRIERGIQQPSAVLAAELASVFSDDGITELHILYPDRYREAA